ncbi:MAG: ribonuclease H-like domain-containing protein [bacterium]
MSGSLAGRLALLSRQAGRLPSGSNARQPPHVAGPDVPPGRAEVPTVHTQAAAAETVVRPDTGASFTERMQRITMRAAAFVRPTDEELAERLGGRLCAPGLIEIEYRHPLSEPHGCRAFEALVAPDLDWLTGPRPAGVGRAPLVFIDTETTGLAGGTGTLAFLVGIARVKGPALVVTQWLITRFSAEPALLGALLTSLGHDAADGMSAQDAVELVSYNGKSFDLPLLCTRLKMARMGAGLARLAHHDLLHPVRTAFARRWPDCRLQTAERLLLGIERSDDLPGHRIPAVWADFVQFGETRELDALVLHNRIDLLSLAALLPALAQVFVDPAAPLPASVEHPWQAMPDSAAIARMQRRRRRPDCARAHLLAAQAAMDDRALLELADLHRARGDWSLALPIWQALADTGSLDAAESLAKYHEHVSRDLAEALRWCEALCRAAPADPAHAGRLRRLQQRRQRHGALFG